MLSCSNTASNRGPVNEVIAIESAKLRDKWVKFQDNCPTEARLDLQKSEPTVEGVADMVKEVMNAWQTKRAKGCRGKAISRFHRFCKCLDSHSSLLKLLPHGSIYVSVLSGTLEAVIKVRCCVQASS